MSHFEEIQTNNIIIESILEGKISPNTELILEERSVSPLYYSLDTYHNLTTPLKLINLGAQLDNKSIDYLMNSYNTDALQILLDKNAIDINELLLKTAISGFTEGIYYLVNRGANPNTTDKDGNTIYHLGILPNIKLLNPNFVNQKNHHGHNALKIHLLKGNYDHSSHLYDLGFTLETSLLNDVIDSIIIGLETSVEKTKYQAMIRLMNNAGIDLPEQLMRYTQNYKETKCSTSNFQGVYSHVHKLAKKYLSLAKPEFVKKLDNSNNKDALVSTEHLFSETSSSYLKTIDVLKTLSPNNQLLQSTNSELDAYIIAFRTVLKLMNNDFNAEIMNLNGFTPETFQEPLMVYRGLSFARGEENLQEFIESQFKYGHKSFSATNLGFAFNGQSYGNFFDGTYVSTVFFSAFHFTDGWNSRRIHTTRTPNRFRI